MTNGALPLVPENVLCDVWIEIAKLETNTEPETKLSDYDKETCTKERFASSLWHHHDNVCARTPKDVITCFISPKEQAANEVQLRPMQLYDGT